MKFALVDGERGESQPGLAGTCPACERSVVAKCGSLRVWHWAHKGKRLCDPWWEGETDWHRAWKNQFPVEWQEVIHLSATGERHIADVKTVEGWTLEFQHSPLSAEERRSRSSFYPLLTWVVDGTRRKRDSTQFFKALREGLSLGSQPRVNKVFPEDCRLFHEWVDERSPVLIDLGEPPRLWLLLAQRRFRSVYVAPYPRAEFVACHSGAEPEAVRPFVDFVKTVSQIVSDSETRANALPRDFILPPPRFVRRPFRF